MFSLTSKFKSTQDQTRKITRIHKTRAKEKGHNNHQSKTKTSNKKMMQRSKTTEIEEERRIKTKDDKKGYRLRRGSGRAGREGRSRSSCCGWAWTGSIRRRCGCWSTDAGTLSSTIHSRLSRSSSPATLTKTTPSLSLSLGVNWIDWNQRTKCGA